MPASLIPDRYISIPAVVSASATTGTGTVALGTRPLATCDVTTTGNLVLNITASGRSRLILRVTIGTAGHTLSLQYAGATTNVRFQGLNPVSSAQSYPTLVGTVIYFEIQTDGTFLDVVEWYSSITGFRQVRYHTIASATGTVAIDLAGIDDYYLYLTLTGNTTLTIANCAAFKALYIRTEQGGAGSFTFSLPTVTPNCVFPSGQPLVMNTVVGGVNTIAMLGATTTRMDANSTRY